MRRKRSSVSRHVSDDDAFLDVHFRRELTGVLEVCRVGRFRPRSGSIYQSLNILAVPALQQHPSAQCAVTVQAHDPPEHRLVPAYRIRYCYSILACVAVLQRCIGRQLLDLARRRVVLWSVCPVANDMGCASLWERALRH